MRFTILFALVWSLLPTPVRAGNPGPCPSFTAGWAISGPPPITAILYDQSTSQMEFVQNNTMVSVYYPVPISLMQTFTQSRNWVRTFNSYVAGRYEAILIQERNNCPVLQENNNGPQGFVWVN